MSSEENEPEHSGRWLQEDDYYAFFNLNREVSNILYHTKLGSAFGILKDTLILITWQVFF